MSGPVLTGIDVLQESDFGAIAGKRIGLISHRSAINLSGISTFDLLFASPNVNLVSVFTPEHGFGAQMDGAVPSSMDTETSVTFHSLYGATRRPTPEMLSNVDALVFDVQDVGARFYTYISTLAYAMEEAAKFEIEFIVLDRPNVINGLRVEGPVLEPEVKSFVGYFEFPIRHGMTVGEVARWHCAKSQLDLDFQVIAMRGWRRAMWFDQTGLPWLPPSPAMQTLTTAILYPGVCCLERMNVSVGRGTDHPFEWVGAPWIDEETLWQDLDSRNIRGAHFTPIEFSPAHSTYTDDICHGVAIEVINRNELNSVELGMYLIDSIHRQNPVELDFGDSLPLIGDAKTLAALQSYVPVDEIVEGWREPIEAFKGARREYLLY